jgi:SusD family.
MKIVYFSLSLSLLLILVSCELDFQPKDSLVDITYWKSEEDVEKAVNYAYRRLGNTDLQAFISCATDDSYSWSNWPSDIQYAGNGSATTSTGLFLNTWDHYYKMVASCNDVLDNIDKVTTMSTEMYNRYSAEVRVLRAYAYIQLTGFFGDVPLIDHIQAIDEFQSPRTPKSGVVDFIISELTNVTENNYLPAEYSASEYGRVTHGAALGLLARVALHNERWQIAIEAAKEIITSNDYEIDNDYLSLFNGTNKTSKEIMLAAQYLKGTYTSPMATWIGGPSLTGWGQVVPLKGLVDAYECIDGETIEESPLYDSQNPTANRDPRLALTIVLPGSAVNGITIDITQPNSPDRLGASNASFSGYYYRKYIPAEIEGSWDNNSYNDIVLLRYAEVLLTYAEAVVESGNTIDNSVLDAINQVRNRQGVNMPAVTTTDKNELREIIRRERHVEFPLEDNRIFDIRRWKIGEEVMGGTAYGILNNFDNSREDYGSYVKVEDRNFNPSRDYLWPVPLNETGLNPNLLPNNPGW